MCVWADKKDHRVKALAARIDKLSSGPRIERRIDSCKLPFGSYTYVVVVNTHAHTINK